MGRLPHRQSYALSLYGRTTISPPVTFEPDSYTFLVFSSFPSVSLSLWDKCQTDNVYPSCAGLHYAFSSVCILALMLSSESRHAVIRRLAQFFGSLSLFLSLSLSSSPVVLSVSGFFFPNLCH